MAEDPVLPAFDAAKLIADVRRGDQAAIGQAYAVTFGSDLGRLVLAHHLVECGVGNRLGREDLEYRAGMHDGALMLASTAGYDQASVAVAVLTDDLGGKTDDPNANHAERAPPGVENEY